MEYKPGIIHESYQHTEYFQIAHEFNMPIGRYDDDRDGIEFIGSEIIVTKKFKPESSETLYTYIYGYYKDGVYHKLNTETLISTAFITLNSPRVFINVTGAFERDLKIKEILQR